MDRPERENPFANWVPKKFKKGEEPSIEKIKGDKVEGFTELHKAIYHHDLEWVS